jgi:hypothetical protein
LNYPDFATSAHQMEYASMIQDWKKRVPIHPEGLQSLFAVRYFVGFDDMIAVVDYVEVQ